jgi:1-acyl-sn-glycerol-3-phosphate acyltransferase
MKKAICRYILKWLGWNIGPTGEDLQQCVICVAPHTSNFDFIWGELFYTAIGKKANFLMKKEWFFFPFSLILKSMGGIPVNRNKKDSVTEQMVEAFAANETFRLAVTPEGTRKGVDEWKKGFYYIALHANVPIQIAYIDYTEKEMGIKATFHPTGNADEDIQMIRSYYQGIKARHREKFKE